MPKIQLKTDVDDSLGYVLDGDCMNAVVNERINGEYELEFQYPTNGQYYSEIAYRKLIYCKPNPYADPDWFRIYYIKPSFSGGSVTVRAQHISYDLIGIVTAPFTATSAYAAFSAMVDGAYTTCPFTFVTSVSTNATMTTLVPLPIRNLQGGMEGSVLDKFGGEYQYSGRTVTLLSRRGADRGSEIRYGKNLIDIEQEKNCSNVYTAIKPYWYNEEYGTVIGNLVHASGTYDFERVLSLDCTQAFETMPTVADLDSYAASYASRNEIGVPTVSMTVQFALLETMQEYQDAIQLADRVLLGDTVSVYFENFGVNALARVIETRYDVLTNSYISVEIGSSKKYITDSITAQGSAIEKVQGEMLAVPTAIDKAVTEATENITGAVAGNVRFSYDANGNPIELLIMDTQSTLTAQKVWRWNLGGLGYSSTGIDGPYGTAITQDGQIVADYITAGTLNGSVIEAGTVYFSQLADDTKSYITGEVDGLRTEVTSDLGDIEDALRSYIDHKADSIDIRFESLQQTVADGDDANADAISALSSHILIESNKMTFLLENNPYKLVLTNTGIQVLGEGDTSVCEFTADGVLLPQETVIPLGGTLTMGNFQWAPRSSGNLSMVKI